MAPSDACVVVEKRTLGDIPMYVNHFGNISPMTIVSLEVAIADFPLMKDNKIYTMYVFDLDCHLSVTKKRKVATIEIRTFTACAYKIECRVLYDEDTSSSSVMANKISNYSYTIQISSDKIHNPENTILRQSNDLICRMNFAPENCLRTLRPLLRGKTLRKGHVVSSYANLDENNESVPTEEEILSRNIELPAKLGIADIKICARTLKLPAQRAVLAIRSKFFRDYFDKHTDKKEITLDTTGKVLRLLVVFMYKGSLPVQPLETMLEVLGFALQLQMRSLVRICLLFVISKINSDNMKKIREAGSRNGIQELVSEVDNFLASAPKDWTTE